MTAFYRRLRDEGGDQLVLAGLLTKVLGFAAVIIVARNHTEAQFGAVSFAWTAVSALLPFMGLGAYQAFLRYGTDLKSVEERDDIYRYAMAKGSLAAAILGLTVFISAPLIAGPLVDSIHFIRIMAPAVLTVMLMEFAKSYARMQNKNAIAARADVVFGISLLVLAVVLPLWLGIAGYAISLVVAPLLAALSVPDAYAVLNKTARKVAIKPTGFWSYGWHVSAGAFTAQVFYAVDVWMIGHLLPEGSTEVALYRAASLIPLAGLVVPVTVAAADFVVNSANKVNPEALVAYVHSYLKTFVPLTAGITAALIITAPWLLGCFGEGYSGSANVLRIFAFGMAGAWLLRVPFGNLLSAIGLANLNTYTNLAVVILSAAGCWWAVPQYGSAGAAWVTASLMWMSGIASALLFLRHCRSLSQIK